MGGLILTTLCSGPSEPTSTPMGRHSISAVHSQEHTSPELSDAQQQGRARAMPAPRSLSLRSQTQRGKERRGNCERVTNGSEAEEAAEFGEAAEGAAAAAEAEEEGAGAGG